MDYVKAVFSPFKTMARLYCEKEARNPSDLDIQIAERCKKELKTKLDMMLERQVTKDEYSVHNVFYASQQIREYLPVLREEYSRDGIILEWEESESDMWNKAGCIGHKWTLYIRKQKN